MHATPSTHTFSPGSEVVKLTSGSDGVPINAVRDVDVLVEDAVNPGPSTIWLPAIRVTFASLLSVRVAQAVGGGPTLAQFVKVPLAEYVPEARAPARFWALAAGFIHIMPAAQSKSARLASA
jgi:hypothetical protein